VWEKLKRFFSYSSDTPLSIEERLKQLESLVGFPINDSSLFLEAITHQSAIQRFKKLKNSNQRLEFLGDAVLGMIVAEYLFKTFPDLHEGDLTKYRVRLVDKEALYKTALNMKYDKIVLFDRRFIKNNRSGLKSILADAIEALIGAIFLDQGLAKTEEVIKKWIIDIIDFSKDSNYKGQLLEIAHKEGLGNPNYELVNVKGPDHERVFTVVVIVDGKKAGVGSGTNKKNAEQNAAHEALKKWSSNFPKH
jgi:ribonuclease-3